jgi:hypothetical protein
MQGDNNIRLLEHSDGGVELRQASASARSPSGEDRFLLSGHARQGSREAGGRAEQSGRKKAEIGQITMENDLLRERTRRVEANRPFAIAEAEAMGQSSSPSAGRLYTLAFTCRVPELPRSSVYAARSRAKAPAACPYLLIQVRSAPPP